MSTDERGWGRAMNREASNPKPQAPSSPPPTPKTQHPKPNIERHGTDSPDAPPAGQVLEWIVLSAPSGAHQRPPMAVYGQICA